MGCCGEREKFGDLNVEQKWDYVVCEIGWILNLRADCD
jgi:hypothetical protein